MSQVRIKLAIIMVVLEVIQKKRRDHHEKEKGIAAKEAKAVRVVKGAGGMREETVKEIE